MIPLHESMGLGDTVTTQYLIVACGDLDIKDMVNEQ